MPHVVSCVLQFYFDEIPWVYDRFGSCSYYNASGRLALKWDNLDPVGYAEENTSQLVGYVDTNVAAFPQFHGARTCLATCIVAELNKITTFIRVPHVPALLQLARAARMRCSRYCSYNCAL